MPNVRVCFLSNSFFQQSSSLVSVWSMCVSQNDLKVKDSSLCTCYPKIRTNNVRTQGFDCQNVKDMLRISRDLRGYFCKKVFRNLRIFIQIFNFNNMLTIF